MSTWEPSTLLMVWGIGLGALAAAITSVGAAAWSWWTGIGISLNPFTLWIGLANGEISTGTGILLWIAGAAIVLALIGVLLIVVVRRILGKSLRGDSAAKLTGHTKHIEPLTMKAAKEKAERFGITDSVGLPIGATVNGGVPLYSSYEDVTINISGPRAYKTTAWVVPRILDAPGAVLATSNKRDIVDLTRPQRAEHTSARSWVFDPQGLMDEPQKCWWNPLSYVHDAVSAVALTQVFIDATRQPDARGNAFFDDAARNVVAAMLLAAARSGRPLTEVHRWLNDQTDDEPVSLLRRAGQGMMAETLEGMMNLVPETRSGVYGGAAQIMSFLLNDAAVQWTTPSASLPAFVPEHFVSTNETLYCLSQEGRGSAAPIVTALTVAVTEAAIAHAKTQAGGRLALPMLIELDEAANVCRWRELPDMYSHFGSRGICVDTLLQSWSQGVSVWGEAGMKKLWSASNVAVYGGGVKERDFLSMLSDLIGAHWIDTRNISTSATGRSVSTSRESQQRPIATINELEALPRGRGWVIASGTPSVLIRLVPIWARTAPRSSRSTNSKG